MANKIWTMRRFEYKQSRVLLSRFSLLSKNQPQSSSFGACKIGTNKQPNVGGQLPNRVLYWEFRDISINYRTSQFLKVNRNTDLLADL